MLSFAHLASEPEFTVTTVTCRDDHRRWSQAEAHGGYRLVLVRRGRFRRRVAGVESVVDPTFAYLGVPGEEEQFAHPAGGDICTRITLGEALWRGLAGPSVGATIYVDPRLDLVHRRLVASTSTDIGYAAAEQLVLLLGRVAPVPVASSHRDRVLVTAARDLISDGHPAAGGLCPLAELLQVSPYRLSRAFTRELGVSLTRYRNRVRLGRALDRLEGGEESLATLAADLGFADQAHLSRTITAELGYTPTALRRLLAA